MKETNKFVNAMPTEESMGKEAYYAMQDELEAEMLAEQDERMDLEEEYASDDDYEEEEDYDNYEDDYNPYDDYGTSGEKYGWYNGYSDDVIDDAFEGDPEATWNVD